MKNKIERIKKEVLKKIEPSKEERKRQKKVIDEICSKWKNIVIAGSVARDTHLRNDNDIDVFVLLDKNLSKEEFRKKGIEIGKKIIGKNWKIEYAQHPYVKGEKKGVLIEVIPAYAIEKSEEKGSAVDRSPLHTKYLLSKLDDKKRKEIRIFKKFLKGIGVYGAEIKTRGMPGYLAELLIIKYKNFENCLKNIAKWKKGEIIELETRKCKEFDEPLVVIDPTDCKRNVASAFSEENLYRLIAGAKLFLQKPSLKFFFPKKIKAWKISKIKKRLKEKELFAVYFPLDKLVPDIIWGQIYKFEKKMRKNLEANDFEVVRSKAFYEEEKCLIIFELKSLFLQKTKYKIGPKAEDIENAEKFFGKNKIISGPRIEKNRWIIETYRKETNAFDLAKKEIKKKEKAPLGKYLKKAKILDEEKIVKLCQKDNKFRLFFSEYLEGKEKYFY